MAVYDSTNIKDPFYILRSQTPPNMVKQDYFLHELQEKVLADWPYRPNRCVIEKEKDFGEENYFPLEVVLQSVKNDKGTAISKDWVRVVYKNIREETRIGQRFRFSYDFDLCGPNKSKNIWIALNNNFITPTQSQVICRCNGNLAQIYTDENGNNLLHYEPVIQTTQLNQSFFQFSEIAIDPNGRLTIIAQKNKYTDQWFINQRFVIGTDRVYKVENILKTDAQYTYDSDSAGIVRMYLAMDQSSDLDNFETRLAYNGIKDQPFVPEIEEGYAITVIEPTSVPEYLEEFRFKPGVFKGKQPVEAVVNVTCSLVGGFASKANINDFVILDGPDEDGFFNISCIKKDQTMSVKITCSAIVEEKTISCDFTMRLFSFV